MAIRLQRDLVVALTLATAALGCARDSPARDTVIVDTLESGTVVVRHTAHDRWSSGESWRAAEQLRLGSSFGEDTLTQWSDIWDVTLDSTRRVYVLDRHLRQVRVFNRDGSAVRALGRRGAGPGELENPIGMDWGPNGHLWIVDAANARYSVYDTAGTLVATRPRHIPGWSYGWGGGFGNDGYLYEPGYYREPATGDLRRVFVRLRVAGEQLVPTDSFAMPSFPSYQPESYQIEGKGTVTYLAIPFSPDPIWRFDGADGFWFGRSDEPRLYHRTLAGDTTRIVVYEPERVPVTANDRAAIRERHAKFGARHVEALLARVPDTKPAFASFLVDDGGYVWVARSEPADDSLPLGTTFDVFDPSGCYVGPLRVAVGMQPAPRIIGESVVGVIRDDLGVPYVVVHRVVGRRD